MALRIKLQSGAVLDYLDERLGDTRAGAVKAHAGGDAARAALLTAVLSQVKASVSAVVRAHCEVVGTISEPVDTELARQVLAAQEELAAKANEVSSLRSQLRDKLPNTVAGSRKRRLEALAQPAELPTDGDSAVVQLGNSSRKKPARARRMVDTDASGELLQEKIAILSETAGEVVGRTLGSAPALAAAIADAKAAATVIRQVSKGPSKIDLVLAATEGAAGAAGGRSAGRKPRGAAAAAGRR